MKKLPAILCTPETQFSELLFSGILNLMNKLQLFFHILLFIETQFSEQKGSDNHVHQIEFQVYQMIWPNNVGSPKKTQRKKMNKS